jgi:histidine triad (HIT) family protein
MILALALLTAPATHAAPPPMPPIDPSTATGLDGPYDPNNPFARIMRGELPVSKVYEDHDVMVFIPLAELSAGHALVIPKRAVRNLLDLKHYEFRNLMLAVQKTAQAQRAAFGATGFKVIINNGATAGQTVFHLHIHVVPTYNMATLDLSNWRQLTRDEMDRNAAALSNAWPR